MGSATADPATPARRAGALAAGALAAGALALGGCATPGPPAAADGEPTEEASGAPYPPPALVDTSDGTDWVRLVSGEWLEGEVVALADGMLEFESTVLGTLEIGWADVAEIRGAGIFTVVLEGQVEHVGALRLLDERFLVTGADGTRVELPRDAVYRLVPGRPSEADYWSGQLGIGGTARSGNSDVIDYTVTASLLRRAARSRLPIDYHAAYAELEGTTNADNQRLRARYDRFLGAGLFFTPLGLELYRDRFQNLELRASPYTALGYRVVDGARVQGDVTAGLGYRYSRFDTVAPGEDDTEESSTAILGTIWSWDPSAAVEVDLTYSAEVGLEDTSDTNQSALLEVSTDFWWDFDLDVRLGWDRIGEPEPTEDGDVPEKDDYQLTVGLSWDF